MDGRTMWCQSVAAPSRTYSALVSAANIIPMADRPTQTPVRAGSAEGSLKDRSLGGINFPNPPPESLVLCGFGSIPVCGGCNVVAMNFYSVLLFTVFRRRAPGTFASDNRR